MDAKCARLVGAGRDNPALVWRRADNHWLAAVFGMVALLHRREESIHVNMENGRWHLAGNGHWQFAVRRTMLPFPAKFCTAAPPSPAAPPIRVSQIRVPHRSFANRSLSSSDVPACLPKGAQCAADPRPGRILRPNYSAALAAAFAVALVAEWISSQIARW